MISLVRAHHVRDAVLGLEFSDGSFGEFDMAPFIAAGGRMVEPLKDHAQFLAFFVEEGGLAWPNGYDLSGRALHRRRAEAGRLRRPAAE
jgi:hypothetical protein